MKRHLRPFFSASLTLIVTASIIGASALPLFNAQPTQAQTSPQDTDIFTGQFIPAYLGAAYDPSEAFKQMAGTPVYVFAYDTFGKVVNNFGYSTQIKADGSFQAAGLPNASHYGVCVPVVDTDTSTTFRAPLPQDNLQTSFAYSQAEFPAGDDKTKPVTINSQVSGQKLTLYPLNTDSDKKTQHGCRVFLTSSRTVDINNHVNIFPLVPNSVLSVIINDATTGADDFFNSNKPYEIYAQRVVINNKPQDATQALYQPCYTQSGPVDFTNLTTLLNSLKNNFQAAQKCVSAADAAASTANVVAVGPIIRGRSIPYTSPGTSAPGASIFQAYAPRGMYAITYWRPDTRNANQAVTYLTYTGTDNLDTPYNGMAFESVPYPDPSLWAGLSSRDAQADKGNAWVSQKGSVNIWGLVTAGSGVGSQQPQVGVPVGIDDPNMGMVNVETRQCMPTGSTNKTGTYGIYFFTSACVVKDKRLYTSEATIGSGQTGNLDSTPGAAISVNGTEGPSRLDLHPRGLVAKTTGFLQQGGKPLAYVSIDLLINGRRISDVAQTNAKGEFGIPSSILAQAHNAQIYLDISHNIPELFNHKPVNTLYALKLPAGFDMNLADASVGKVNVDAHPRAVTSWLADLSFTSLLSKLHTSVAYAQETTTNSSTYSLDSSGPFVFLVDSSTAAVTNSGQSFTIANYNIQDAHLIADENQGGGAIGNVTSAINNDFDPGTKLMIKYKTDGWDGYWVDGDTMGANGAPTKGSTGQAREAKQITGVILTKANKDIGDDFLNNTGVGSTDDASLTGVVHRMKDGEQKGFILVLNFVNKNLSDTQGGSNNGSKGQPAASSANAMISASQPVTITRHGNQFTIEYLPAPLQARNFNCTIDSVSGSWFNQQVTGAACQLSYGVTNLLVKLVDFAARYLFTVDPIGQFGVVLQYWNVFRNLVNGLSVLILIIAGVAIMFKYEPKTFQLQSILTKLLITIVAVNFSILIIQAVVDVANVLSLGGYALLKSVLATAGDGIDPKGALGAATAIGAAAAALIAFAIMTGGMGLIGILAGILVALLAAVLMILRVILEWAIRYAVLMLCVIFAPAAIAAQILPGTSKYFKKWRELLVGTLLAQVVFALILGVFVGVIQQALGSQSIMTGILGFAMAIGLLQLAAKAPAKVAGVAGAGMTAGLMTKVATQTGSLIGSARKAASEEERIRRRAESELEDKTLERLGGKKPTAFGRGLRSIRQITGIDVDRTKKRASKLHAIEEGEGAGVSGAKNSFMLRGEANPNIPFRNFRQRARYNRQNKERVETRLEAMAGNKAFDEATKFSASLRASLSSASPSNFDLYGGLLDAATEMPVYGLDGEFLKLIRSTYGTGKPEDRKQIFDPNGSHADEMKLKLFELIEQTHPEGFKTTTELQRWVQEQSKTGLRNWAIAGGMDNQAITLADHEKLATLFLTKDIANLTGTILVDHKDQTNPENAAFVQQKLREIPNLRMSDFEGVPSKTYFQNANKTLARNITQGRAVNRVQPSRPVPGDASNAATTIGDQLENLRAQLDLEGEYMNTGDRNALVTEIRRLEQQFNTSMAAEGGANTQAQAAAAQTEEQRLEAERAAAAQQADRQAREQADAELAQRQQAAADQHQLMIDNALRRLQEIDNEILNSANPFGTRRSRQAEIDNLNQSLQRLRAGVGGRANDV